LGRAALLQRRQLDDSFAAQSERQRLGMLYTIRFLLDGYLSMARRAGTAPAQMHGHVLAWKGAVGQRLAEDRLDRDRPAVAQLRQQLRQARTALARLSAAGPAPGEERAWRNRLLEQDRI